MIKTIIFDFDGLMVDTEMISYKCYQALLKDYGISFSLDDYTKEYPGTPARMAIQKFKERYQIPCEIEEALHTIDCLEKQFIKEDGVPLKPGLRELLTYLKKAGYQVVVATSSLKKRALHILKQHQLENCFDDFTFGYEVTRNKPFPDIFLKACEKMSVKPSQALVLEDSEAGIQAAYDAHIPVICIPDMKYPSPIYEKMTTAIFPSLMDIISFLESNHDES